MSQQNPTIIVGHLDDSELTKSIDKLVNEVANKTTTMAGHFTTAISEMEGAMKSFAITQKVSVDLMKEAWRDMSKSFDAMVAAQSGATGGGKGSGKAHAPNTIGALEQEIAEIKQERKEMELNSNELRTQNALLERRKNLYKQQTTSPATRNFNAVMGMQPKSLSDSERQLKLLEFLQRRYAKTTELSVAQQNRLAKAIQKTKEQIEKLKPKSLDDVLGVDAKSIDQIAAKMRALKMVQIDPNNTREVNRLGKAYADLKRQQAKMLGQNIQLTHSNNYLAQSFGYIRNRIVYALTLGAITNFVKQLYEIRGQYELLERSLGVLVGSFEKGTQIFNELNEMAIKSPFTLIELGTAAKQLTAYNFAANEVVDTTRRLADISAALGVPMERLTYNLGQIKAQGVLNARDARDFANAGLAIVPMLAKMYTEQKTFGDEMVTTAQVYEMMSKKMVTYSDVLKVLYQVTDEGGKFFDFQAKQADTLRVQMANLTLAYNNMLNEIGSENQGILSGMVGGLKTLLKHWRDIQRILLTLITTFGVYKTVSMLAVGAQTISAWISLAKSIKSAKDAMALFNLTTSANPLGLLASLLAGVIGYFVLFKNEVSGVSQEVEMFGESASKTISKVNTLKKVIDGTDDTSNTYKKTLSELSNIAKEYGVELDAEKARRDEINKATEQTIQLIKEESAERQRANQLTKAQENYDAQANSARQSLRDNLKTAMTGIDLGIFTTKSNNKEIQQNADAIADIIGSVVESNIMLIAGKTGDEYEKGLDKMFSIIQDRMRAIGISESTISKQWLSSTLFSDTNLVNEYINNIVRAKNEQDNYVEKIEKNYKAAKKATEATMTFTQKVDANARALRNNTDDAVSLYNRIYDIVKIAKENHVINFDLKLSAEKPPKWMLDKSLPELQQLAERFTAIAQSGGHIEGYNRESTYERGLLYASAARIKQEEEERNARNKDHKTKTKQSDEIAKAIKDEISLVKQLQSAYDTLTKKGDSHANAIAKVQDLYGKTIELLNKDMDKFGLPRLDLSIIKGNNHNEVLAFFEKLRDVLESKGLSNLERMEAVEGVVKEFRLKAETYNLDMITKGLNSELDRLKEEYELAVAIDADPELGGIFADMFDLNIDQLPHTISEYAQKVTAELNKAIKDRGDSIQLPTIYLTKDDINAFRKMSENDKLNKESFEDIQKAYQDFVSLRKKAATDVSKIASDYIREYGDLSAQIQQIEIEKNDALMKLNEIYNTDALRQTRRYLDAKFAIEDGARRKQAKATFDALKKEADYERFFTAIDTLTKKDALSIKNKIKKGIIDAFKNGGLTISQFRKEIKALEEQFDKLSQPTSNWISYLNGGFDKLIQRAKETGQEIETIGEKISATGKVDEEDKNYLQSLGNIFSNGKGGNTDFSSLMSQFGKDMKGLGSNISKAGQGMQGASSNFASTVSIIDMIIKNIHQTVQGINSVIQELDSVRNEENKISNAYWEGFSKSDSYASSGWENLKSGNISGAIADTANSIISIFNTFENAKTDRINSEIKESERTVKNLENAYKNLEYASQKAFGTSISGAKQATKANKELQLAELRRQLVLENSRSSKNKDIDKINEIKGQIIDLEHEINDFTNNAVNELLGISSHGDFFEEMISEMISAFKNGEDAMKVFEEKWSDMIDNMLMKTIVSQVLSQWIKTLERGADEILNKYTEESAKKMADAESSMTNVRTMDAGDAARWIYENDKENFDKILEYLGERNDVEQFFSRDAWFDQAWDSGLANKIKEAYFSMLDSKMSGLQSELDKASLDATGELIDYYGEAGKEFKENYLDLILAKIKENWKFGEDSQKELSALQQGIQGITEDTAGALEAYMNGVSQQVYLHSDLLTQIRDAVVGIEIDAQIATQAQMLLQLQQSYTVQMAIQGILEGWSSPNGMSVRVEMQ